MKIEIKQNEINVKQPKAFVRLKTQVMKTEYVFEHPMFKQMSFHIKKKPEC